MGGVVLAPLLHWWVDQAWPCRGRGARRMYILLQDHPELWLGDLFNDHIIHFNSARNRIPYYAWTHVVFSLYGYVRIKNILTRMSTEESGEP
jgi:hypothetical protein